MRESHNVKPGPKKANRVGKPDRKNVRRISIDVGSDPSHHGQDGDLAREDTRPAQM
jgi:hypothetical protein